MKLILFCLFSWLLVSLLVSLSHSPPQDLELLKGKDFGLPHFRTLNPHLPQELALRVSGKSQLK